MLPWSCYFCLLCWIISMAYLDEGQTRMCHKWLSRFPPNRLWCWEFYSECNRLDYWDVLRKVALHPGAGLGWFCSLLPTARCVSVDLKTSYPLATSLWRRWQPFFIHWAQFLPSVPASLSSSLVTCPTMAAVAVSETSWRGAVQWCLRRLRGICPSSVPQLHGAYASGVRIWCCWGTPDFT